MALGVVLLAVLAAVALRDRQPGPLAVHTVALEGWPSAVAVDTRTTHAFIASSDVVHHTGRVSVLDTTTGTILGTVVVPAFPTAVAVGAAPRRAAMGARVFVAGYSANGRGCVSVLDARSGRILRTVVVYRDPSGAAPTAVVGLVVDDQTDRAFVAGYLPGSGFRGIVSMLDATSGRLLRTVRIGTHPAALVVDRRAGRVFVASAGGVGVLDARRGVLLRTLALSAPPAAMAVDERRRRLFIGTMGPPPGMGLPSGTAHVSVLDASGGTVITTVPLSASASALAVDEVNGHALVGTMGGVDNQGHGRAGRVRVLDGRRGAVLRTVLVGQSPVVMAVDGRHGRVVVATRDTGETPRPTGRVLVLDARSGRILHTLLRNTAPVALAVDERAGRAVVVSYGGTVGRPDAWRWVPSWLRAHLSFLVPPRPHTFAVPSSASILDLTR
jgi:DNA-binding beta-propeller fold protein YncE